MGIFGKGQGIAGLSKRTNRPLLWIFSLIIAVYLGSQNQVLPALAVLGLALIFTSVIE